jgi:hypothetical protein
MSIGESVAAISATTKAGYFIAAGGSDLGSPPALPERSAMLEAI